MRFPFNRRPAPPPHPDDWVTRLFERFMASPDDVAPEASPTQISAQLRALVADAMQADGTGARRFEEAHGLRKWSLRGFLDPQREQSPSVDRAQEIAAALGYALKIERAGRASDAEGRAPTRSGDQDVDFAGSLRRIAASRGFNQTALAERVGISTRRMAHYFAAERRPSFELLLTMSEALDVSLYELLGIAEPEPASPANAIAEGSPRSAVVGMTGEAIGLRIREERERLCLTQIEMAEAGGASRSSQKLYEKGKPPSTAYLAAISAAGVDVLYIVTGRREGGVK